MSKKEKTKTEAPKWKGPWLIHFFKRHKDDDPAQSIPGREFLDACSKSVRAKLLAIITAVADAPPPMFSGGGKWEAMHGDMSGFYEAALTVRAESTSDSSASWSATEPASASEGRASSSSRACVRRSGRPSPTRTTSRSARWASSTSSGIRGRWPELSRGLRGPPASEFDDQPPAAPARVCSRVRPPGARRCPGWGWGRWQ